MSITEGRRLYALTDAGNVTAVQSLLPKEYGARHVRKMRGSVKPSELQIAGKATALYEAGVSSKQIAADLGKDGSYIWSLLVRAGVDMRERGPQIQAPCMDVTLECDWHSIISRVGLGPILRALRQRANLSIADAGADLPVRVRAYHMYELNETRPTVSTVEAILASYEVDRGDPLYSAMIAAARRG